VSHEIKDKFLTLLKHYASGEEPKVGDVVRLVDGRLHVEVSGMSPDGELLFGKPGSQSWALPEECTLVRRESEIREAFLTLCDGGRRLTGG
jgi:hypothetical protein